ncbi:MAG: Ig-like domain-containing protein [Candidatus Gracilibacteria bacterium]|nr:Ig-like domain-containing protein [Candidatus Gracilibacteria bacterium]MDD2908515.1 Ig-like domain-containing protein [Candidatus Gracilibacteria bacterium]
MTNHSNRHDDEDSLVPQNGGIFSKIDKLPKGARTLVASAMLLQGVATTLPAGAAEIQKNTKSAVTDGLTIQKGEQIEGTDKYKVVGGKKETGFDNGRGLLGIGTTYSSNMGMLTQGMIAHMMGDDTAFAIEVEAGSDQARYLATIGYKVSKNGKVKLTYEHFEQALDFTFKSGTEGARIGQNSVGLAYEYKLPKGLVDTLAVKGYFTQADSKDLGSKEVIVDTTTLYEIYKNERNIAGGRRLGGDLTLGMIPWNNGKVKLTGSYEQTTFDKKYDTSNSNTSQFGGKLEFSQKFQKDYEANLFASTNSTEKYIIGGELNYQMLDNLKIFINGQYLERRSGIGGNENTEFKFGGGLTWAFDGDNLIKQSAKTYDDNMKAAKLANNNTDDRIPSWSKPQINELLTWVAKDPVIRSNSIIVVVDESYKRLIAIDKTALPIGADVDLTNGNILVDVVPVIGINSITKDGVAFTNNGNFTLSGGKLVINTGTLQEPAVGEINTYLITIDEVGGGQTIVNLVVEHGSVKIRSLTVSRIGSDINSAVIGDPTAVATNNQITLTNHITDDDGVQNIVYYIYSDAAGTALVASGPTQEFPGLTGSTVYYYKTTAETKNMPANTWTARTSAIKSITTLADDAISNVGLPTVSAITSSSATVTNGITDVNGVQNIVYYIYSDAAGTILKTTNTTGIFNGLDPVTNYWSKTTAETKNATFNTWEPKTSGLTAFSTVAAPDTTNPVATGETVSTSYNTALLGINVLSNDTDNSGTVLLGTVTSVTGGTFTKNGNTIDFTPTSGFTGAASCTYQVKDPSGNISTATLIINVSAAPNAIPTANNFTYGTNIGNSAKTFDWAILSAAADANGDSLTATVKTPGTMGTTSIVGHNLTYTPNAGQTGSDNVVITISDGNGGTKDITITVNGVDTVVPTMSAPSYTTTAPTNQDVVVSIISSEDIAAPSGWTKISFGAFYEFSKTYSVNTVETVVFSDSAGNTTSININIANIDKTLPTAVGESTSTAYNTALLGINVLSNDSDNSGTVLLGTITNQVGGVFAVNAGKIDFVPTDGFSGVASCTYQVKDLAGNISTAVLTVNVLSAAPSSEPTNFILSAASDTGSSTTDGITNSTNPILTWTAVVGATSYQIWNGASRSDIGNVTTIGLGAIANGTYTYKIRAKNSGGTGPDSLNLTIVVDRALPVTPTLNIAGGADYTNSTTPAISITESDNVGVTGWYVTENSSSIPTSGTWSSTKPTTGTISSGDGTKTLYVFTKDAAGNISAAGSDTIVLDTVNLASATWDLGSVNTGSSIPLSTFNIGENVKVISLTNTTDITGITLSPSTGSGTFTSNITFEATGSGNSTGIKNITMVTEDQVGNLKTTIIQVTVNSAI